MNHTRHPAVARIWRGRVPRARADEYERYLREAGIPPLEKTALAVQLLREGSRRGELDLLDSHAFCEVARLVASAGPYGP